MSKNAIIITSIDGLATVQCGIASVVHWFFEAIEDIVKQTPRLQRKDWDLYALSPEIDTNSSDYSNTAHAIVTRVCQEYGGNFSWFPVPEKSSLSAVWSLGEYEKWNLMCESLACRVRDLCKNYNKVTLIAHGIMLTGVRKFLMDVSNLQVVFIAHSLGRVFEDKHSAARTEFEDQGFAAMERFPQDRIGYGSPYFKEILSRKYHRPDDSLAPFLYSIHKDSFRFPSNGTGEFDIFKKYKIPRNKKLIFSWGRCTGQKGFDVLIPSFGELLRHIDDEWHLVLLMPQEVSPKDYVDILNKLLMNLPSGTFSTITTFDEMLPYHILRNSNLKIAVFPSRFESGPLTLIEALTFGHENLKIVWHDIPSMANILKSQPIHFPFSPLKIESLVQAMLSAARHSGISIKKDFIPSYSKNTSDGLNSVLTWW